MADDIAQAFGLAPLGWGDRPSTRPRLSELVEAEPDDDWRLDAACRPELRPPDISARDWTGMFFPKLGESAAQARAVCRGCPVVDDCLAFALAPPAERHGVWAGASERQRRRMRNARRAA